jgi:hypothetical protein
MPWQMGLYRLQVQTEQVGYMVAVGSGFGKMIARIDKVNRDTPVNLAQYVQEYNAMRLKGRGGKQAHSARLVLRYLFPDLFDIQRMLV